MFRSIFDKFIHPAWISLVVAAVTPRLVAQAVESAGPFAGAQFVASIDDPAFTPGVLYRKRTGFSSAPPRRWRSVDPRVPKFDLRSIVPNGCDIDAISIGMDDIAVDPQSGMPLPGFRWTGMSFTVTPATVGGPGSAIRAETLVRDAAGAVFSYVWDGGDVIACDMVGETFRSQARPENGLPIDADIDAIDFFMPTYALEPGLRPPNIGTRVFFSVSTASLPCAPCTWWRSSSSQPSGADIFVTTWRAVGGALGWSLPTVWRTAGQLNLQTIEDVDALAIDSLRDVMVYSTDVSILPQNPILVAGCGGCDGPLTPRRDLMGVPVSTGIGLCPPTDDVNGICIKDPSDPVNASGININIATPQKQDFAPLAAFVPPRALTATAFRGYDRGLDQPMCETYLIGGPVVGARLQPGLAALGFSFPNPLPYAIPEMFFIRPIVRPPSGFVGNPMSFEFSVPAAPLLNNIELRWFVADGTAGFTLWEAYPVLFHL